MIRSILAPALFVAFSLFGYQTALFAQNQSCYFSASDFGHGELAAEYSIFVPDDETWEHGAWYNIYALYRPGPKRPGRTEWTVAERYCVRRINKNSPVFEVDTYYGKGGEYDATQKWTKVASDDGKQHFLAQQIKDAIYGKEAGDLKLQRMLETPKEIQAVLDAHLKSRDAAANK